jgi:hypothetical protein
MHGNYTYIHVWYSIHVYYTYIHVWYSMHTYYIVVCMYTIPCQVATVQLCNTPLHRATTWRPSNYATQSCFGAGHSDGPVCAFTYGVSNETATPVSAQMYKATDRSVPLYGVFNETKTSMSRLPGVSTSFKYEVSTCQHENTLCTRFVRGFPPAPIKTRHVCNESVNLDQIEYKVSTFAISILGSPKERC